MIDFQRRGEACCVTAVNHQRAVKMLFPSDAFSLSASVVFSTFTRMHEGVEAAHICSVYTWTFITTVYEWLPCCV